MYHFSETHVRFTQKHFMKFIKIFFSTPNPNPNTDPNPDPNHKPKPNPKPNLYPNTNPKPNPGNSYTFKSR